MVKVNNVEELEINVCIWDWKSYNEGVANFKWFNLPSEVGKLEDHLCVLEEAGLEEPFICDTDGWGDTLTEYTSINKLIDVMLELEGLDQYDLLEEYYEIYPDDRIMEVTDDNLRMAFGDDLSFFANRVHFGSYNALDPYFYLDGYWNICTITEAKKEELEASFIRELIEQRF